MTTMNDHTITFSPRLTDEEFWEFTQRHDDMNFEVDKEGIIRMMTPSGNESSDANAEIITQLRTWWRTHRQGRVFDSNTLFKLRDGSKLGPDAAYITAERLALVPREELRRFAAVCPNFVIELRSLTDSLNEMKDKMRRWIENGVEVGWLIDPYGKDILAYVFSVGVGERGLSASALHGTGPVVGFVLDLTEVWKAYE